MKLLIDMNLSPDWVGLLSEAGFEAVHWSVVGDPGAADAAVMDYARVHDCVVFTRDLDFGAILAATGARTPSVIQVRTQNVDPASLGESVIALLRRCREHLEAGALICLDPSAERVRILPLRRRKT